MKLVLFTMLVISVLGFCHSVAHGMMEDKQARMYYMIADPKYFKRATFFAFATVVLFTLFLNAH